MQNPSSFIARNLYIYINVQSDFFVKGNFGKCNLFYMSKINHLFG